NMTTSNTLTNITTFLNQAERIVTKRGGFSGLAKTPGLNDDYFDGQTRSQICQKLANIYAKIHEIQEREEFEARVGSRIGTIIERVIFKPIEYCIVKPIKNCIFKPVEYCILKPLANYVIEPLAVSRIGRYIGNSPRLQKAFGITYFTFTFAYLGFAAVRATQIYIIPAIDRIKEAPEEFKQKAEKVGLQGLRSISLGLAPIVCFALCMKVYSLYKYRNLASTQTDIKEAKDLLSRLSHYDSKRKALLEVQTREAESSNTKIKSLQSQIAAKDEELKKLRNQQPQIQLDTQKIQKLEKELLEKKSELTRLTSEKKQLEESLKTAQRETGTVQRTLDASKKEYLSLQVTSRELTERVSRLEQANTELTSQLSTRQGEFEVRFLEIQRAKEAIELSMRKLQDHQKQRAEVFQQQILEKVKSNFLIDPRFELGKALLISNLTDAKTLEDLLGVLVTQDLFYDSSSEKTVGDESTVDEGISLSKEERKLVEEYKRLLDAEIASKNEAISKLKAQNEELLKQVEALQAQIATSEPAVKRNGYLTEQVKTLQITIGELREKAVEQADLLTAADKKVSDLEKEISRLTDSVAFLERERTRITQDKNQELADLQGHLKIVQEELASGKLELAWLKRENAAMVSQQEEMKELTTINEELREKTRELLSELRRVQATLQEDNRANEILEEFQKRAPDLYAEIAEAKDEGFDEESDGLSLDPEFLKFKKVYQERVSKGEMDVLLGDNALRELYIQFLSENQQKN
ncbi:MAG: hypothetical protein HKM07_04510, partial [Chlamydiae bacterium]|nr:hypothetical protein [Chlamydiota bacterium]